MAARPCSGSSTSPLPVSTSVCSASATISMASRRRSTRSVRQSRVSSTAARIRLPWCFELGLEALLQREGVGGGAGEAGQDLVVVQAADLARRALDDDVAQGDLAIAAQCDAVAATHAHDGGGVKLFHAFLPLKGLAGAGRKIQGAQQPGSGQIPGGTRRAIDPEPPHGHLRSERKGHAGNHGRRRTKTCQARMKPMPLRGRTDLPVRSGALGKRVALGAGLNLPVRGGALGKRVSASASSIAVEFLTHFAAFLRFQRQGGRGRASRRGCRWVRRFPHTSRIRRCRCGRWTVAPSEQLALAIARAQFQRVFFLDRGAVGRVRHELGFRRCSVVSPALARMSCSSCLSRSEERQLALVHIVGLGHGQQFFFAGQINRRIARRLA